MNTEIKAWDDVDAHVATADVLIDGMSRRVALVGFVANYPPTPRFVAYRWMYGAEPASLGENHWPGVNKGLCIAYARKDHRFKNVKELHGDDRW